MMKRWLLVALFAFVLAAGTGVLLRFGLIMGMPPWAANFTAVRHAHSHLMYFGWVTLALMALIWHYLPRLTGRALPKGVGVQMVASALLALLSFPAFWANGYGVTEIGAVALPLGSIAAGLNGILWLLFAGLYLWATWRLPVRPLAVQLWDWAIILLVIAFGGALGLVGLIVLDSANFALQQLFLHLFLDLFAVGWFNLALLGLLWAMLGAADVQSPKPTSMPSWLPTQSLAMCLMPTFLLGVSPVFITDSLFWIGATANLLAAVLMAWHLYALWRWRSYLPLLARFGLLILGVHIVSALFVIWPGFWQWSTGTQLRIFFLHNLLLGWVSSILLGTIMALCLRLSRRTEWALTLIWSGGVATMLLALLGVGFLQFVPFRIATLFRIAAWSSIVPPLVALWMFIQQSVAGFLSYGTVTDVRLGQRMDLS